MRFGEKNFWHTLNNELLFHFKRDVFKIWVCEQIILNSFNHYFQLVLLLSINFSFEIYFCHYFPMVEKLLKVWQI